MRAFQKWLIVFTLMIVLVGGPGLKPVSGQDSQGAWIKTNTEILPWEGRESNEWYTYYPAETSDGLSTRKMTWKDAEGCGGSVDIFESWTPLPDTLVPGEELGVIISAGFNAQQNCSFRFTGGSVTFAVTDAYVTEVIASGSSDLGSVENSKSVAWTIPGGYEGQVLTFTLGSSGRARYTYVYTENPQVSTEQSPPAQALFDATFPTVHVIRAGEPPLYSSTKGDSFTTLTDETQISADDIIRTGKDTRILLTYPDGSVFKVKSNSLITFLPDGVVRLQVGESWFQLRKVGKRFQVITPITVCGVLGTTFSVSVEEDGATTVRLAEGRLEVDTGGVITILEAGQMIRVSASGEQGPVETFDTDAHEADWEAEFSAVAPENPLLPNLPGVPEIPGMEGQPDWLPLAGVVLVCLCCLGVVGAVVVVVLVMRRKKGQR